MATQRKRAPKKSVIKTETSMVDKAIDLIKWVDTPFKLFEVILLASVFFLGYFAWDTYAPYTDLMKEVKVGFGRTMSHLPAVFGVSRQTLYNWLNGETPKEQHQGKLVQLAAAARAFAEAGFKPTAPSLDRTVAQGKSFVELIGQGADGKETAERLVRIEKRGAAAREKLDALLGDRSPSRPNVADMGRPALNEDV
jgi:transcriptional regulator with XRE-family HTH domain